MDGEQKTGISEGAHWMGTPVLEMNGGLLRAALFYQMRELIECRRVMTPEQNAKVVERMKSVPVPVWVLAQRP